MTKSVPVLNDVVDKKIRKNKTGFSTSSKRIKISPDLVMPNELKDMKKLESNDEAFHLSFKQIRKIVFSIQSREMLTPVTYMKWDEYAVSFYLKMHTCFGFVYQQLDPTSESDVDVDEDEDDDGDGDGDDDDDDGDDDDDENGKKPLKEQHLEVTPTNVKNRKKNKMLSKREVAFHRKKGYCRRYLTVTGPFEFGSYSSGTKPDRIPYHLYQLVKKAVDIMNNPTNDLTALIIVEEKISFFCNYFHSHLPPGWNYDRDKASTLIADYDITRKPIYCMDGFTPIFIKGYASEYDEESGIARYEMIAIMSAIHSRKTPSFWKMSPTMIAFYCKLCSCFGIKDYHDLESASEDDVCLMNMGQKPSFHFYVGPMESG